PRAPRPYASCADGARSRASTSGAPPPKIVAMDGAAITRESYRGWPNTYRLANDAIEVRVLSDVGPRIIDLRRRGADNLLYVRDAEAGGRGEPVWRFRGG